MVVGRLTASQCNAVHTDQIWKDYVRKESISARNWDTDWGFLKNEYTTLRNDMTKARSSVKGSSLPEAKPSRETLKLPPLAPSRQDTSRPFPVRQSQLVGWRSGERSCVLEVYGRWGRPKWSIIKQLKWPNDAVP